MKNIKDDEKIKNKILVLRIATIFLIVSFLFIQFLQVSAQEELAEITEISSTEFTYSGEGVEIIDGKIGCKTGFEKCKMEITPKKGEGKITIEATQGIKYDPVSGKITVAESGEFILDGTSFKDIKSGEILIDQKSGKLIEADYLVTNIDTEYDINGQIVKANKNGRVKFKYSEQTTFETPLLDLPEGGKIFSANNIGIKGQNIDLGNGLVAEEIPEGASISFDSKGNMLASHTHGGEIKFDNKVDLSISGALDKTQGVYIFRNLENAKKSGVENYIIFGDEFNANLGNTEKSGGVHLKFKKSNPYAEVGENGLFEIAAGRRGNEISSSINIRKGTNTELPVIDNKGFRILNDHTSSNVKFGFQGIAETVSIDKYGPGKGKDQVPMLVRNQLDKEVDGKTLQIASLYSDIKEKVYFTSNIKTAESLVMDPNLLSYRENFKPTAAEEIPFMKDVFEKNVVVTMDSVAMIEDKDFIDMFQDYKPNYKNLKVSQNKYQDKYFEEYKRLAKNVGKSEADARHIYNNAKSIVNDPKLSFQDKDNQLKTLYKSRLKIDYYPTLKNPDPAFIDQTATIAKFYYEAENKGYLPPRSSQFSLAPNERAQVDKLVSEGILPRDAIKQILKIGPNAMFSDPYIPAQEWWGIFR